MGVVGATGGECLRFCSRSSVVQVIVQQQALAVGGESDVEDGAIVARRDQSVLRLVEQWRIERSDILNLERACIRIIAPLYRRRSVMTLLAWFDSERTHA
jgi:hypothetical protein